MQERNRKKQNGINYFLFHDLGWFVNVGAADLETLEKDGEADFAVLAQLTS